MLVFLFMLSVLGWPIKAQSQTQSLSPVEHEAAYQALAQVLENEQLRHQLIEQLHTMAADQQASQTLAEQTEPVSRVSAQGLEQSSLSSRWIEKSQIFTQNLRQDVVQTWGLLSSLGRGEQTSLKGLKAWRSALLNMLITMLVAVLVFRIGRVLARSVFRRFDRWAQKMPDSEQFSAQHHQRLRQEQDALPKETVASGDFAHLQTPVAEPINFETAVETPAQAARNYILRYGKLRKLMAVVGAFFVDVLLIFVAALVAYIVSVSLPGSSTSTVFSLQFLTAFITVELVKVMSRGVFATGYEQLRLLPITDQSAAYWNRWVSTVVLVGGYGLLVLVPVLQAVLSVALANVLGAVLILAVYIYAVSVLWRRRHSVSNTLLQQAARAQSALSGTILRIVARVWLYLALLYFTVLFFVTQADQQNALGFMAKASAQTLLVLLLGATGSLVLNALMAHRLHLSARWNKAFPLLEARLNSYVPISLQALRFVLWLTVLLSLFDAWQVLDLRTWLSTGQGQVVLNTLIRVAVVLFIAAMTWTILASVIEHRLSSAGVSMPTEREKTLLMLFRNALAIVILTMTILIVLSQVGIDIGPLIAGAGVVGLAIGFGAQKLVQDVITGVFIQLENGMNQNDVVEVAGLFGVVEKLTIRSVVIRTLDGGYHLVPFSAIDCVANHTRDYGYHYGEYCIGLRESVDDAIACLRLAFADTKKDPEVANEILEDISIPGVTSLNREGFTIRVLIKTAPGMQWAVQRSFNRWVKIHFDAAGIELPYPHTVLHFGRDKNGYASPADIRMVDAVAQNSRGGELVPAAGQTLRPIPEAT